MSRLLQRTIGGCFARQEKLRGLRDNQKQIKTLPLILHPALQNYMSFSTSLKIHIECDMFVLVNLNSSIQYPERRAGWERPQCEWLLSFRLFLNSGGKPKVRALLTWEKMHRGWERRMPPVGMWGQSTLCMRNKGEEEGRMIRAVVAVAGSAACYLLLLPGPLCFYSNARVQLTAWEQRKDS